MSTHVPGFQSFYFTVFASFCIGQISHRQQKDSAHIHHLNYTNSGLSLPGFSSEIAHQVAIVRSYEYDAD